LSLGWTTASVLGGRLVGRLGFQVLVRAGCALIAVGIGAGYLGMLVQQPVIALLGQVLYGLGMGATISSFTVSVQERAATHQRGIATALAQFSRSIGGAIGVAALGAVLAMVAGADVYHSATEGALTGDQLAALAKGLESVFGAVLAAALLGKLDGVEPGGDVGAEIARGADLVEQL